MQCLDIECSQRTQATMDQLVYVVWKDASFQEGQISPAGLRPLVLIKSAGFLIQDDGEVVSLCIDYYPKANEYRYVVHIPKVNIIRMKTFDIGDEEQ